MAKVTIIIIDPEDGEDDMIDLSLESDPPIRKDKLPTLAQDLGLRLIEYALDKSEQDDDE